MVKEPLCVVGLPAYMYWMLREVVFIRLAVRSILKSLNGSSVMRICRSSV
jgi:hypothetical protein